MLSAEEALNQLTNTGRPVRKCVSRVPEETRNEPEKPTKKRKANDEYKPDDVDMEGHIIIDVGYKISII